MIISFRQKELADFYAGKPVKRFVTIRTALTKRLLDLDAAIVLADLRVPPGNRLEALKCDRRGQHSIRVNDQWRLCFQWTTKGSEHVEIVDYH